MKRMLLVLLLVLGCFSLFAGAQVETKAPENVELKFWTFLDPKNPSNSRAVVLGKLIENFEKANPGVKITIEPQVHSTLAQKMFAAHATNSAADLFMVPVDMLGRAIELGVPEPLENMFLKNWTAADMEDVTSGLWTAGTESTGLHYQVPLFGAVYGILYRADHFKKFGIEPKFKNWEELYAAAKKLTFVDEKGMQVYGLGIGYNPSVVDYYGALPQRLLNKQGGVYKDDGYPNDWAGEEAQEALQLELDAVKMGITPASAVSMTYEDVFVNFAAGQYSMIFITCLRIPQVMNAASFDKGNIKFMPIPEIKEGEGNRVFSGGWFTGAWSKGNHKEIAGKFLEYLISPEADALWVTEAQQIPIRKSTVPKIQEFFAKPENEWVAIAAQIKPYTYVAPARFSVAGQAKDWQNAFILAATENYSVKNALEKVQKDFIERNLNR